MVVRLDAEIGIRYPARGGDGEGFREKEPRPAERQTTVVLAMNSFGTPSDPAPYCCIGEMTIRFGSVTLRSVSGLNRCMAVILPFLCGREPRPSDAKRQRGTS